MYRAFKVGEEFQLGMKIAKAVRSDSDSSCTGCIFDNLSSCDNAGVYSITGQYEARHRKDKTEVIFVFVDSEDCGKE